MSTVFWIAFGALWLLVLVQGVLLLLVYRHFGLLALDTSEGVERDGLLVGQVAPAIVGVNGAGASVTWEPPAGENAVMLFASPDCGPCAEVLPYVDALSTDSDQELTVLTVVAGPPERAGELIEKFKTNHLCLAEGGNRIFDRYRVRVTPFAFIVGADGRVRNKGVCGSGAKLQRLLEGGGLGTAASGVRAAPDEADRWRETSRQKDVISA